MKKRRTRGGGGGRGLVCFGVVGVDRLYTQNATILVYKVYLQKTNQAIPVDVWFCQSFFSMGLEVLIVGFWI